VQVSLDSISKSFRRADIVDDAKIEELKRWYPSAAGSESARHATASSPAATPCREPAGSGAETSASIDLSIILPAYNEEACVELLYEAIAEALKPLRRGFEIVFVDDGSTDATFARFEALAHADARVRVIKFRRNCGQTAAMAAGIEHAEGAVLVTMDADLQNDPADIPRLLRKIEEGYALVVGWHHNRQDRLLSRKLPSALANWLIARVTGIDIKDNGCSLKAYRADLIKVIPLYSEMHRFIPAMVAMAGGRIAQIKVRHHPRQFGRSKYGLSRVHKVLLDLVIVKTLLLFARRPLFCFSGAAAIPGMISAAILAVEVSAIIHGAPPSVVFMSLPILFGSLAIFLFLLGVVGFLIYEGGVEGLRRRTGLAQQRAPAVQVRTDQLHVLGKAEGL
jgi:Glycosyl transferase family 2